MTREEKLHKLVEKFGLTNTLYKLSNCMDDEVFNDFYSDLAEKYGLDMDNV